MPKHECVTVVLKSGGHELAELPMSVPKRGAVNSLSINRIVLEQTHDVEDKDKSVLMNRGENFRLKILIGKLDKSRKLKDAITEFRSALSRMRGCSLVSSSTESSDFKGVFFVLLDEDPSNIIDDKGFLKISYSIDSDYLEKRVKHKQERESRIRILKNTTDEIKTILAEVVIKNVDEDLFTSIGSVEADAAYTTFKRMMNSLKSSSSVFVKKLSCRIESLNILEFDLILKDEDSDDKIMSMSSKTLSSTVAMFFRLSSLKQEEIEFYFVEIGKAQAVRRHAEKILKPLLPECVKVESFEEEKEINKEEKEEACDEFIVEDLPLPSPSCQRFR